MGLLLQFMPILKSLINNKLGAILIAVQTAFTLAILINATFIISQRIEKMLRPTGMDLERIVTLSSQSYVEGFNDELVTQADLKLIRSLPGVIDASSTQALPLSGSGWSSGFTNNPDEEKNRVGMAYYLVDDHIVNSLGITLKEGRTFHPEEVSLYGEGNNQIDTVVLITNEAALELYPDGDALGKPVYSPDGSIATVIGIIEHMQGSWVGWDGLNRVMLVPKFLHNRYIIRVEANEMDNLLASIEETLTDANRGRLISQVRPMEFYLQKSYRSDRAMSIVLSVVMVLLVVIAGLGIVSLATFNVNQRVRQIGTRRALGATRIDILNYFLLENWIVTGFGVVLGSFIGIAFNYWLMTSFDMPRLDWYFVAGGILMVWALGLISVLKPARLASLISPALATRNI